MKGRSILFQDRLVRLNLAGLKTETRRVGPGAKRWLKAEAGDVLWVRETWTKCGLLNRFHYRATARKPYCGEGDTDEQYCGTRWKPSIHMPRTACRLFLELQEKPWEEPLQDLTVDGALAEGVQARHDVILPGAMEYLDFEGIPHPYATAAFSVGWDEINAKRGYSWNDNPTVTVLRYRKVEP